MTFEENNHLNFDWYAPRYALAADRGRGARLVRRVRARGHALRRARGRLHRARRQAVAPSTSLVHARGDARRRARQPWCRSTHARPSRPSRARSRRVGREPSSEPRRPSARRERRRSAAARGSTTSWSARSKAITTGRSQRHRLGRDAAERAERELVEHDVGRAIVLDQLSFARVSSSGRSARPRARSTRARVRGASSPQSPSSRARSDGRAYQLGQRPNHRRRSASRASPGAPARAGSGPRRLRGARRRAATNRVCTSISSTGCGMKVVFSRPSRRAEEITSAFVMITSAGTPVREAQQTTAPARPRTEARAASRARRRRMAARALRSAARIGVRRVRLDEVVAPKQAPDVPEEDRRASRSCESLRSRPRA